MTFRRRLVFLTILLLLPLAVAGTFLPFARNASHVCTVCGHRRAERVFPFGITISLGDHPTAFTEWFDEHVKTPHDHRWSRVECSATLNIWLRPIGYGCGSSEPLVSYPDGFAHTLRSLEPHGLHLEYFHLLTAPSEDIRWAAAEAAEFLDPTSAKTIRNWWNAVRVHVESPWDRGPDFFRAVLSRTNLTTGRTERQPQAKPDSTP